MLGEDYKQRAQMTKSLLIKSGLLCSQAHAPTGTINNDSELDESNPSFLEIVRAIEYAAIIGANNIVIHGIRVPSGVESKECFDKNLVYYKKLQKYAEQSNIKISIENLIHSAFITPKLLNQIIDSLPAEYFNVCLDVGHANCVHINPEDFIEQISPNRLQALHIHDNLGIEDVHLLPYMGNINWTKVMKALLKYGFQGDLTLEIEGYLRDLSLDNLNEKYKNAFDVLYKLKSLI